MKIIKIYSPCDGFIDDIKKIDDEIFNQEMLGKGFFIKPKTNIIYSPISGELEEIFWTKHAYVISQNEFNVLIHIGIDSVRLEGKPFKIKREKKAKLKILEEIVEVDFEIFKENKISTDIPVVFNSEKASIDFKILKSGDVKKGDLVGELHILEEANETRIEEEIRPIKYTAKYDSVSMAINNLVGGKSNFKKFYNCMTRLRIIIIDKELVDIEGLKKLPIVKGTNWNGEELQIIIGGEVYKVKDSLEKQLSAIEKQVFKKKNKASLFDQVFAFLGGVITPILPILIGAGMIKALASVLQISGAIQTIKTGTSVADLANYDFLSVLIFLVSDVGLVMIGFFFGYSTVKYLGGNTYIGALVALTMLSPALFNGQMAFKYFDILGVNVGIKGYTASVIPQIGAAAIYVTFDKWVQKWMPPSVDIVFRHFLSILVATIISFTLVGPTLGLLEALIGNGVLFLDKLPLGLGTGIYSGVRQILVITGLHSAISALIGAAGFYAGESFNLMMAVPMAVFGQLAVCIAVAARTGNSNLRQASIAAIPSGIFGVTEPIIYGVTLPRIKVFGAGCLASFVGGVICGITQVHCYSGLGQGVLFFTGVFSTSSDNISTSAQVTNDLIWYSIALITVLLTGFILVLFLFKERKNELVETKVINKAFAKKYPQNKELLSELKDLEILLSNENMKMIKKCETSVRRKIKFKVKLASILTKEENLKEKYATLSEKYYSKNKIEKVKKYNELYNNVNFKSQIDNLEKTIIEVEQNYLLDIEILKAIQNKYTLKYQEILKKWTKNINDEELFANKYFNCIHSLNIAYQLIEKK